VRALCFPVLLRRYTRMLLRRHAYTSAHTVQLHSYFFSSAPSIHLCTCILCMPHIRARTHPRRHPNPHVYTHASILSLTLFSPPLHAHAHTHTHAHESLGIPHPLTPQIHVTGPIWRKALDNEIETKGELVSINDATATIMSPECGMLTFGTHKCLSGYVPQEGDRVRACVVRPPPAPPGDF
jgi:hypothetical protein